MSNLKRRGGRQGALCSSSCPGIARSCRGGFRSASDGMQQRSSNSVWQSRRVLQMAEDVCNGRPSSDCGFGMTATVCACVYWAVWVRACVWVDVLAPATGRCSLPDSCGRTRGMRNAERECPATSLARLAWRVGRSGLGTRCLPIPFSVSPSLLHTQPTSQQEDKKDVR